MLHFVVIVQARENSTRLPEKVIKILEGKPLLSHIIARIQSLHLSNLELRFAIPNVGNKTLYKLLETLNQKVYRGDEFDVLSRYVEASKDLHQDDWVIRLTADNPFIDQDALAYIIHEISTAKEKPDYAYATGLPLGMGFEFIKVNKLRELNLLAQKQHQREHVTVYFRENKEDFSIREYPCYPKYKFDYHQKQIRLTVDEPQDFLMARKILQKFKHNVFFNAADVLELFTNDPSFFEENLHIEQKTATSFQDK